MTTPLRQKAKKVAELVDAWFELEEERDNTREGTADDRRITAELIRVGRKLANTAADLAIAI